MARFYQQFLNHELRSFSCRRVLNLVDSWKMILKSWDLKVFYSKSMPTGQFVRCAEVVGRPAGIASHAKCLVGWPCQHSLAFVTFAIFCNKRCSLPRKPMRTHSLVLHAWCWQGKASRKAYQKKKSKEKDRKTWESGHCHSQNDGEISVGNTYANRQRVCIKKLARWVYIDMISSWVLHFPSHISGGSILPERHCVSCIAVEIPPGSYDPT